MCLVSFITGEHFVYIAASMGSLREATRAFLDMENLPLPALMLTTLMEVVKWGSLVHGPSRLRWWKASSLLSSTRARDGEGSCLNRFEQVDFVATFAFGRLSMYLYATSHFAYVPDAGQAVRPAV